jgi:hypothetical protein
MKFCINEKVKVKTLSNETQIGVIVKIREKACQPFYDIYISPSITFCDVPESSLIKAQESAKISALDILKDKSGGQMQVSILAVQKILAKLQSAFKEIAQLKADKTKLAKELAQANHDLILASAKIDDELCNFRTQKKKIEQLTQTIEDMKADQNRGIEENIQLKKELVDLHYTTVRMPRHALEELIGEIDTSEL